MRALLARFRGGRNKDAGEGAQDEAVCQSFVRMLHRLGVISVARIGPSSLQGERHALYVTIRKSAIKVSQEAMGLLSERIVGHARKKYRTDIECVYWRIDCSGPALDQDGPPTVIGYLVEEGDGLGGDLEEIRKMIATTEMKVESATNVIQTIEGLAIAAEEQINRNMARREQRGLLANRQA